jgi:hypothetical protein
MKILLKLQIALLLAILTACTGKNLISNKKYFLIVEKSFTERTQLASNRKSELFSIFDQKLSLSQKEALKYLYAFMPLSDLADYNGEFFLANADISLRTKKETSWGKDIPEDIFLHYVLPCRINNENLDSFRIVYYNEIIDRVQDKDIMDAALEINHWCHEKVSYQPADSRTSAPMSTILSARGRCGEESTFTVAALRTAGIPARQVYTPRWAHSDDNHAWVEIWHDGEWYYMGACEPEPVLDMGWFTEPARRAMLVHTKSFGAPSGNENSINRYEKYTEVNNLSKYAITKGIFVKVIDQEGLPIDNARVEYQLYNYAEYYPLAVVPTNEDGISHFETGLGDLLIWANKDDDFGYKKISVSETDTLILKLNHQDAGNYSIDLDLDVPVTLSPFPGPEPELIELNAQRINEENILRQKYIDTWIKPGEARKIGIELNIDTAKMMNIFARSMGNYNEIRNFLLSAPDSLINRAVLLLDLLTDKDLRDIKRYTLSDHLKFCYTPATLFTGPDYNIYLNYILNPRIANEMIVAWRSYLQEKLPSQLLLKAADDPNLIVKYINENIKIADTENYYKTPLTPKGVFDLKVSDSESRSIFFVAACRSMGIPARLEPGSNVPQYFFNSAWNDVYFADQVKPALKKGYIKLISNENKPEPEYYIHFTIARFENGRYNTLEYEFNKKIHDFTEELALPPGNYMLVTGNRLNDSKILSSITFFDLFEGEHKFVEVHLRKDVSENIIHKKIKLENIISLFNDTNVTLERICNKGIVAIWIEPDKEPTKHIFNDLPDLKSELDEWGGYFLFLSGTSEDAGDFNPEDISELPENCLFGVDKNLDQLKNILESSTSAGVNLPYVIQADQNGNILFTSMGYRIGIGEQILKHIKY